jgi:hypothetical protein
MNEGDRKERNRQRLTECFPTFAKRVEAVIKDMEAQGFRPRIQDAHRSIPDQLIAFKKGFSKTKFGFHNVTGAGGKPESLAVDLLDDDKPLNPTRKYMILLAGIARAHGLHSGIFFLPAPFHKAINKAIAENNFSPAIKIGFDPTHIEATGVSITQAKAGKRPT